MKSLSKNLSVQIYEQKFIKGNSISILGHLRLKKLNTNYTNLHELQSALITRTLKTVKICSIQF